MSRVVLVGLCICAAVFVSCFALSIATGSGINSISVLGILATTFSLFLPRRKRTVVGFNLIILYVGTLILQAIFAGDSTPQKRTWGGIPEEIRSEHPDIVPVVVPQRYLDMRPFVKSPPWDLVETRQGHFFPLSGIANQLTLYCKEDDGWMMYPADQRGFNNPAETNISEEGILFIGDSFTQGACVPCGKGFVEIVRANELNAYNAGMGGAGPLTELAILTELLEDGVRPDVVVWAYCSGNDIMRADQRPSDLDLELSEDVLKLYLADTDFTQHYFENKPGIDKIIKQRLAAVDGETDFASEVFQQMRRFVLGDLADKLRDHSRTVLYQRVEDSYYLDERLPVFQKTLTQANSLTQDLGIELIFLYLPTRDKVHPFRDNVISICDNLSIPLIDADSIMPRTGDLWAENGGHLSTEGYQKLAGLVTAFLKGKLASHTN